MVEKDHGQSGHSEQSSKTTRNDYRGQKQKLSKVVKNCQKLSKDSKVVLMSLVTIFKK